MRKAFVLFLACGLRCFGAEDCTLTVRVIDEVGQPVSNATVEVGVISATGFNAGKHSSDYTYYSAQTALPMSTSSVSVTAPTNGTL